MRIQLVTPRLIQRVTAFLITLGARGVQRSTLMKRYRTGAEELDEVLAHMRQQQGFHEWKPEGSIATYYSYTPPAQAAGGASVTCAWCTTKLLSDTPVGGFCSAYCAAASAAAAIDVADLLARALAVSPYAAFDTAVDLVLGDLRARGFEMYRAASTGVTFLLLARRAGVVYCVRVLTANHSNEIRRDPAWVHEKDVITAHVLAAGRIIYAGLPGDLASQPTAAPTLDA